MAEGLPFVFPYRGRSHLKSKTVHTLLRILSLCGEESHSSHTQPIAADALNSGVHSEKSENITEPEACNENLSIENGLVRNKSVEIIPIEPTTSAVENHMIANDVVALFNNQSDELEESRQQDESLNYEISEAIKPAEDTQVRIFSSQLNVVEEVAREMQQKETGLTEPVNLDTALDSSVCLITDAEIEDGEIPDDLGVYGQSIDLLHEDFALLEEMKDGEDQISGEGFKQRESDNAQNHVASTFCHVSTADSLNASRQKKLEERKNEEKHVRDDILGCGRVGDVEQADGGDRMLEARRNAREGDEAIWGVNIPLSYVDSLGYSLKTSDNIMTDDQGSTPKVKEPKVLERKKKTLTKERKAKRKVSEKKRRARKDRELGVKRLKIEPISKPKVVKYCEFFMKGRCQKGDSCKFSHDTIPLTKSQPCTFFARNSCMKGDDCPFDHQLFKYPCDNYTSKGDCNRGDKCKFSHKLVENPTPSSNIKHTEAGSQSLPCSSNTKRHQNTKNTYSQNLYKVSKETSQRTPLSTGTLVQRNLVENVSGRLKTPAQAPKGVTFLSFGSSPTDDSNNRDVQKDQNASEKPQNSNDLLWKTLVQAPKGVNFLSFGSSSTDNSNNRDVQKHQNASEKPQNSNELLWKTPATLLPLHRSSTNPSPNGQNSNSAQRALSSTLAFAAKYEKEMMKGRPICTPDLRNETNKTRKSSTSSSIDTVQNEWKEVSPILQEFLIVNS